MKIILCVLIVWYFHSNHALDAKGDLLQNGDPEAPFFAGRGRRGGELNSFEGQFGENKDGAPSASDARRYFDPDLLESRMRLPWPLRLPMDQSMYPARMQKTPPVLDVPTAFYIWYNIRKKQAKSDLDSAPFMAARG
ncbi:hypothetical protein Fcan01_07073 [Folsomia candida]|uniref:Uncharacterized protein n=1 Tax=Folsomia candida TaxID=158441 RepID=A0A226EKC0_FOLCA|nr:hypothetical protein Fcan01_07073 [Folsomia candida]